MIWLRRVGGVIVGVVIVLLLVTCAEALVHQLYPPAPRTNMNDMNEVKKYVAALPLLALVLVLIGWGIGTLVGTYAAAKIAGNVAPAYILGLLLVIVGIANAMIIPQPVWFTAVSLVLYIVMTLLGARLATPAASP